MTRRFRPLIPAGSLRGALAQRYAGREWLLMFEVSSCTGYSDSPNGHGRVRRADALALNLFPSKGWELHGFEMKASRSDWLAELADLSKSTPVKRYCDRWWLVAEEGVVMGEANEVPLEWGLMVRGPTGLRVVIRAPRRQPEPWSRGFVASVARAAAKRAAPVSP